VYLHDIFPYLICCVGAYAVLFCLCTYVLLFVQLRARGVNKPLLVTAIAMFALSTAHVVIELVEVIGTFLHPQDPPILLLLNDVQVILYVTNKYVSCLSSIAIHFLHSWTLSIIADGLVVSLPNLGYILIMVCQIYRCYTVWGSRWKVVAIPVLMLIGTTSK
jgi:hypothetical protein